MIKHPRGLILEAMAQAGLPNSAIQAVADQVEAAYDEVNQVDPIDLPVDPFSLIRPGWPGQLATFEIVEPHETPATAEAP